MSGRRDKDLVAPVAEIAPLRWVLLCLRRVRARIRRGPSILPSRWQPVALAIAAVLIGTSLSFANDGEEIDEETRDAALELNEQGVELVERGKLEEAIARFREGLRLVPKDEALTSNLAAALNRRGLGGSSWIT